VGLWGFFGFPIDAAATAGKDGVPMELLRKTFWIVVFLFATLCFVVLFEKGPDNFLPNVKKQVTEFTDFLVKTFNEQVNPKKK
jgi:hypothetical protein